MQSIFLSPAVGRDGEGGIVGGGELRLPFPEHSRTVYCNQAHYEHISVSVVDAGVKGGQAVVGEGRTGCLGIADGGLRGGTGGEGRGDGWDRDGDRLIWWEDNAAHINLCNEHNSTFVYATILEHDRVQDSHEEQEF